MIKQVITFEDFDGKQVTEDHYFHLSKSELIDMELSPDGAMSDKLERISKSANGAEIMRMFKEIIGASYGQRVDGSGSQFYKTPKIRDAFLASLAFDALLDQLLTDANFATDFVNGLMPKDLVSSAEVQAALKGNRQTVNVVLPEIGGNAIAKDTGLNDPFDLDGKTLPWAFREPTQNEMMAMNALQMQDVYRRKSSGWVPMKPPGAA